MQSINRHYMIIYVITFTSTGKNLYGFYAGSIVKMFDNHATL